jgi:hypothetical protein
MVCMQIQNREAPCIEWQSTHELSRSDKGFIIIHLLLRLYAYFLLPFGVIMIQTWDIMYIRQWKMV